MYWFRAGRLFVHCEGLSEYKEGGMNVDYQN